MPKRPLTPKPRKTLKSSLVARRLIRAAIKQCGGQRGAAKALHLPNQAQLRKMLRGEIKDTKQMLAEIARRERLAHRTYWSFNGELTPSDEIPVEKIVALHELSGELLTHARLKESKLRT